MKIFTQAEQQEHLENWKNGGLSKAAYAKSVRIHPTTFYTWTRSKKDKRSQGLVEINKKSIQNTNQDIVIEKGNITIRVPLSADAKELQTVFSALEGVK
jgi:hypothetical protein